VSNSSDELIIPTEFIERRIFLIRGQKVMIDTDLASLYGTSVIRLNEQVRRNMARFPRDFMFQLTPTETARLRSQIVTSKNGRGGRRYLPLAFTEQGVAMLSSALNSERAVQVSVAIIRTFVKLRQLLSSNANLAKKLEKLEKQYDAQSQVVFKAIRELMSQESIPPSRRIGFHTDQRKAS